MSMEAATAYITVKGGHSAIMYAWAEWSISLSGSIRKAVTTKMYHCAMQVHSKNLQQVLDIVVSHQALPLKCQLLLKLLLALVAPAPEHHRALLRRLAGLTGDALHDLMHFSCMYCRCLSGKSVTDLSVTYVCLMLPYACCVFFFTQHLKVGDFSSWSVKSGRVEIFVGTVGTACGMCSVRPVCKQPLMCH